MTEERLKPFGQVYAIIGPADYIRYLGKHQFGKNEASLQESLEKYLDNDIKGAIKLQESKRPLLVWLREMTKRNVRPIIKCIEVCYSLSELNSRETYWIAFYRERYPDLLNRAPGGSGGCDIPWNKGKTKEDDNRIKSPWNNGLSSDPDSPAYDERVALAAIITSKTHADVSGDLNPMHGRNDQCYVEGGIVDIAKNKKGKTYEEIFGTEKAKEMKENLTRFSGPNSPRWKPENHIVETRECACACGRVFECKKISPKRFIQGHGARGRHKIFSQDHKQHLKDAKALDKNPA